MKKASYIKLVKVFLMANMLISCAVKEEKLPDYKVYDPQNPLQRKPQILQQKAHELSLPLSAQSLKEIAILEKKFDQEKNCAGLAAPQIGIAKQIIVFAVPQDPELKKWRKDFTQSMDKTIWINPSYQGIGQNSYEDYEGCFSVKDLAGRVKRYQKILYKAYDVQRSQWVEGIAEGFLARVIQHEIDHVNGILCIDKASEIMTLEGYRKKQQEAMNQK